MKLNTNQQSVVDRMRDGWLLHIHGFFNKYPTCKIQEGRQFVHHSTRVSLREKGVIHHDFRSDYYFLTEAYRDA